MSGRSDEEVIIRRAIARLRAGIVAIVVGVFSGSAIFLATIWLLLRGGPRVGQHLQLLGHYFPGYSVTPVGAVVGFFWAALVGGALGWLTATLYNWAADLRVGA